MYSYYEKLKYYTAVLPDTEWTYSYSAEELQTELRERFAGTKLRGIYVSLDGYLEALHSSVNTIDLSYMGGTAIIIFDKTVLQLEIYAEGMIEYRCFPAWEMKLREVYDYPPEDMICSEKYYFNAADHEVEFEYTNSLVENISVKGCDTWGFDQSGFDAERAKKAAEKNDLPAEIVLHTDVCEIRIVGEKLEFFWVFFKKKQS